MIFANNRRRIAVAVAVVLASAAAWAVSAQVVDGDAPGLPGVVVMHGADSLPFRSSQDWVSYADMVVVADVVAEARIEPTAEEIERGEGLVGRTVTAKTVQPLWVSPNAKRAVPESVVLNVAGWVIQDGQEIPFVVEDALHVAAGDRLILPLFWDSEDDGEWGLLSPRAVVVLGDNGSFDTGQSTVAQTLARETNAAEPRAADVAATLERTPQSEEIRGYESLDARSRWEAVAADKRAS